MDYLMFIDRITQYQSISPKVQFLVSGNDSAVRNTILNDVLRTCRENEHTLLIVDDTGSSGTVDFNFIRSFGYQVQNGMSGEYCLYNPFQIASVKGMSKIRQLLSILEYDEKQKGKLIAYLSFLRHMEYLEYGNQSMELTLEKLGAYCTTMAIEEKLQHFLDSGIINERQQLMLLAKYSECSAAAADFEDMLFALMPFISGKSIKIGDKKHQALVFQTGELGEDETMRSLVMQLLQFGLEENRASQAETTVLILDKGYGSRMCVFNLIKALPVHVDVHIFSEDIFTLCDPPGLAMILNRFTARVYSRHLVMSSAEAIEKACGEIDVVKNSYNVTYDRRWRANRPWDVLMRNNKTESYTQMAPVREPRYRKEMILSLAPGNGIVEYMGNTSLFSV